MNSNTAPPARASSSPQPAPNAGLSTKASGWAGAGGAGDGAREGLDPGGAHGRGSSESFLGCPSNKTSNKGPELWGQLAAQLNLRGIRVDTGMVTGYMG